MVEQGLTLKDVFHDVLRKSKVPTKELAESLGVSYSLLMNAGNPDQPGFNLQARLLLPLTQLTGDHRLLDYLEARCGRVAFALPEIPASLGGIQVKLAESTKEFGDVLQECAESLKDGTVSPQEAKRIEKEAHEQIRALMSLVEAVRRQARAGGPVHG